MSPLVLSGFRETAPKVHSGRVRDVGKQKPKPEQQRDGSPRHKKGIISRVHLVALKAT
jgi:hypothetical protein